MADGFSKMAKTTAIYLARIGVEGTSGNHTARKTVLELHLMNAALDAIKQRYGFEGFHLVGQSGGSKLVGGLIGLRHDIACAVVGLRTARHAGGSPKPTDPGRTFFDVTQNIPQLAQNRSLRLLLVTRSGGQEGPHRPADRLRRQDAPGGTRAIPQFLVEATDEDHHGVVIYSELVAAGCVLGKTDAEIARAVSTIVKRSVEYNARRRAGSQHSRPGIAAAAARQPVLDSRAAPGGA